MSSTVNLYDVLDISHDVTPIELKKAYRKLVKEYYPRRPNGDAEMFELITHAYNILSNDESRKEYDGIYKLSKQSNKSHTSLKTQSDKYYKAQETTAVKKSKEELEIEFKKSMNEMDHKRKYKRGKTSDSIDEKDASRRFKDLEMARIQEDIELTHDQIFKDGRVDDGMFNAAWDESHNGSMNMIPHSGNPNAWNGLVSNDSSYSSVDQYDDVYAEDINNYTINDQNFSSVNFDSNDTKNNLTKEQVAKLKPSSYTSEHNVTGKDYNKLLEERLNDRKIETGKYEDRNMDDFNSNPDCGGYGIFENVGMTTGSIAWDNGDNGDDINKKYKKLLEFRNKK